MVKEVFSFFGWAAESSPQPSGQVILTVGGLNPFVGRWQGTNTLGAFCEAVFSADGRFSSVMQSAWRPVHQRGVYKIVDDKTIWFGSVPDTHIQVLPGSNGQLVASNVEGFPQETDFYQFRDVRTMVIGSIVNPAISTTYTKVG
jgi:hypothetical protein